MEGRQAGGREKNGRDSEWVNARGTGNIVGEKRAIRGKDGDILRIEVGRNGETINGNTKVAIL